MRDGLRQGFVSVINKLKSRRLNLPNTSSILFPSRNIRFNHWTLLRLSFTANGFKSSQVCYRNNRQVHTEPEASRGVDLT